MARCNSRNGHDGGDEKRLRALRETSRRRREFGFLQKESNLTSHMASQSAQVEI